MPYDPFRYSQRVTLPSCVLTAVSIVFLSPAGSATYRIDRVLSSTPGEPQVGPGDGPPPSAAATAAQAAPRAAASASIRLIASSLADTGSTRGPFREVRQRARRPTASCRQNTSE